MIDNEEKLIRSEIKSRKITCYLATEEDLQNVKSNSLLGDIFFLFTSLSAGGYISVQIAKGTGLELNPAALKLLDLLSNVFLAVTVFVLIFAFYFHFRSFNSIKKIKDSGKVQSLQNGAVFEIIKAEYWTQNARLDITDELRKLIVDNKLETIASNKIKSDPDVGIGKNLTIEYKFNNIKVKKEFKEGNKISLP